MLFCLTTVLLLAAAEDTGPRLGTAGVELSAGTSRSVDASGTPVRYFSSSAFVEVQVGPTLDVELSYELLKREARGPSHIGGVTARLYPAPPLDLGLTLLFSPLGRRDEGTYCTPDLFGLRCEDAVERLGFLNPALSVGYTTNPDAEWVGIFGASVEATFYRLDYRSVSGATERPLFSVPLQEYRLGLEAAGRIFDQLEVGARGTYGTLVGALQPGEERPGRLPPTELPVAPTRFEVGPRLTLSIGPALMVRASGEYAPYIFRCFGHSLFGSLRLTVLPGPLSLFGQVDYRRDVSPTDAATLQECDQEVPEPDYVSTSARAGVSVSF